MAEVLRHHKRIIETLAAKPGLPNVVVTEYYLQERLGEKGYGIKFKHPLADLVDRSRDGEEMIPIPESTNAGDAMCGACRRFSKECWHGHTEYDAYFPGGGKIYLPHGSWKHFSMDVQSNNKINLFSDSHMRAWYTLPAQFGINSIRWAALPCDKEFLPENVAMMMFYIFYQRTSTSKIVPYVEAAGSLLVEWGGIGTQVLIRINSSNDGTSMRPEGFRYKQAGIFGFDVTGIIS